MAFPLVSELVGVLQWFVDLCHSVVVSTSQPQRLTRADSSMGSIPADSPASTESLSGTDVSPTSLAASPLTPQAQEVEDSMVALAKNSTCALLSQWTRGTAFDDAIFVGNTHRVVAVAVLLWKSLGRLSMAVQGVLNDQTSSAGLAAVEPLYVSMSALVRLWRGNFGTFGTRANRLPEDPSPIVWRLLSTCSNDSDLAILLFCSLAKSLLQQIEESPESLGLRHTNLYDRVREDAAFIGEQRLNSAKQTTILAQAAYAALDKSASSSPQARSLCLLSMNTFPILTVQAYTLATRALADELKSLPLPSPEASDTAERLRTATQCLDDLKSTLVTFPIIPGAARNLSRRSCCGAHSSVNKFRVHDRDVATRKPYPTVREGVDDAGHAAANYNVVEDLCH